MEYQFTHTIHGVVAKCSMEHEAFARWLNTELSDKPKELERIFDEIERCRQAYPNQYQWAMEGKEYSLYIDTDEVMIRANNLDDIFDVEEIEDGFHYYDEESMAFCGLEDFEAFLKAFQRFSSTYH